MRRIGIYQIQSKLKPNRIYIGSAVNISNRWNKHLWGLRKDIHHNVKLQKHYNKYGESDLVFSVLIACDREDLIKHEQFFIDATNPWFNLCRIAGNCSGTKRSKETIKKLTASRSKRSPISEETRQKMRDSHRGQKPSKEALIKRSISMKGKNSWSKGKHLSIEHRKKQSIKLKGKTWEEIYGVEGARLRRTAKYRKKLSEACKGRIITEEQKKKTSESCKRAWLLKKQQIA